MDDIRINAPDEDLAWEASSRWAKGCAYLGLQDAARKRREPSQAPGAWAGSVVSTTDDDVTKFVTQERWEKTQRLIRWIANKIGLRDEVSERLGVPEDESELTHPKGTIPFKQAERIRGFLIYVSRTYGSMVPYLKGLHLTLDSWRPFRDEDGWAIANQCRDKDLGLLGVYPKKAPTFVTPVKRLKDDIGALMALTVSDKPPRIPLRPSGVATMYLVGDASGSGFGVSKWKAGEEKLAVEFGTWNESTSKQSSNFREAVNFVIQVEEMVKNKVLKRGTELFLFTDNYVTENAFFKGSSKSKTLHNLVLRLRKLEMLGELFIRCVWIAGTRMIAQGTDGLSRGDLTSGVMTGKTFLSFVPLNLGAIERSPRLLDWLKEYVTRDLKVLAGEDWFDALWDASGTPMLWVPPPCLGDVALENFCEFHQCHPGTPLLFLCPELMTNLWRKKLGKACDVVLKIPKGTPLWPADMHESLYLGLTFPLLSHRPWRIGRTQEAESFRKEMPELWGNSCAVVGNRMRKFWTAAIKQDMS